MRRHLGALGRQGSMNDETFSRYFLHPGTNKVKFQHLFASYAGLEKRYQVHLLSQV